jgi:hypothetical protein
MVNVGAAGNRRPVAATVDLSWRTALNHRRDLAGHS